MRRVKGEILLSASDLMRFMGCTHAIALDLQYLRGEGPKPREDSEDAELLQKKGNVHEAAYLTALKSAGRSVVEIRAGDLQSAVEATRAALIGGPDVIYQGALLLGRWGGWSDFLEKVERPSKLGAFSYEVTDTKLKRRPHPNHVLQLVLYSDLLTEVQGMAPSYAHIQLGNGTRSSLRLADYSHYARLARSRLEAFISSPEETRPVPCADCALCRWEDHCHTVWKGEDSLFNVANIARSQVKKLEAASINTLAQLSCQSDPIRSLAPKTLENLRSQARLQQARKDSDPGYELRSQQPGKGFDLLPEPQTGDLFYDIEGNPHYEGGLEYLHGVWCQGKFRSFWAHDHAAERKALADLLEFFRTHLASHPSARIYHYAPYEITALRRLTTKYGVGENFLDRLLRERRFVDLYAVVRGGVFVSEPNYSIKSLEVFYGLERTGEVKTAGGSVVAYEKWMEVNDQTILDEIEQYNRTDCISTEMLRNWLVSIRPKVPWPLLGTDAAEKEGAEDETTAALTARLASSGLPESRQELLFNLAQFHKRERKPAWWAIFDSLGREEDELIDDLNALAGLVAIGPSVPVKRSMARLYRFPPQETKLRAGRSATIPTLNGFASVNIDSFDRNTCEITLKVGKDRAALLVDQLTLHPEAPLDTQVLAAALDDVIADQCGARGYQAVDDLLSARAPRLSGGTTDILGSAEVVAGTIAAVHRMQNTVLPIQGPPGTGKTHVSARAILSLVKAGHRIGVTSNSHEAIKNVLLACWRALEEEGTGNSLQMVHKVSSDDEGYPLGCPVQTVTANDDLAIQSASIVGATGFFFSRQENVQAFDWLFVDEAGQVSLANMSAMGRAACNIVLVGDPRQLPQLIQGAHPHPANLSCLEWMLGEHATVPADRGIFLAETRRMHPLVCEFISQQVYEGRLSHQPDTARQKLTGTRFPEAGAFFIPVLHEANSQVAPEEVAAISSVVSDILIGNWTDKDGVTRHIQESDIIVVAPYNAQVNALRAALPTTIRAGTVDKFQGQEAPICLVSMTTSSSEEIPRGIEFLFSLNRINVAVSRAKGLALVFGSPKLREAKCTTVQQMHLVNALCALPKFEI